MSRSSMEAMSRSSRSSRSSGPSISPLSCRSSNPVEYDIQKERKMEAYYIDLINKKEEEKK
jgi:hypothetical protein